MIRINPFFLRQRSYHFEGTGVTSLFHFHSRVLMCFHAPLRPRKMDKFLFLGTHTRFITTKRIMVTPPLTILFHLLTTSFMNFIVIEIKYMYILPRQNLELAILLPSRQRFTSVERMIHSDRHESPTPLNCQNPCCIFERGGFLLGPQRQNVGLVPTVHPGRKDSLSRDH